MPSHTARPGCSLSGHGKPVERRCDGRGGSGNPDEARGDQPSRRPSHVHSNHRCEALQGGHPEGERQGEDDGHGDGDSRNGPAHDPREDPGAKREEHPGFEKAKRVCSIGSMDAPQNSSPRGRKTYRYFSKTT